MRGLAGDARRYGWVSLPLAALWILAAMRLFVDPTPRIPLLFNWSAKPALSRGLAGAGCEPSESRRFRSLLVRRQGGCALPRAGSSTVLQDRRRAARGPQFASRTGTSSLAGTS
ncbi:MAG: hypothetical protein MZW92_61000 [Comamonadaceae bacterium]|nr:hypothetical protein [Comamonadaceae bacterium]